MASQLIAEETRQRLEPNHDYPDFSVSTNNIGRSIYTCLMEHFGWKHPFKRFTHDTINLTSKMLYLFIYLFD